MELAFQAKRTDRIPRIVRGSKKKRSQKLGKELELFAFQTVGQGLPFGCLKAALRERLENFLKKAQKTAGQQVITPHIGVKNYMFVQPLPSMEPTLFNPSIHLQKTKRIVKTQNCPHHCEIYKTNHDLTKTYHFDLQSLAPYTL